MVAAWVILVVGIAASLLTAVLWRDSVRNTAAADFDTYAQQVEGTLHGSLQRDADFTATLTAMVATHPDVSNVELQTWYEALDGDRRYAGGVGFAFIERVPRAALPAFTRTIEADPLNGVPHSPHYTVSPPGDRAEYCLPRLALSLALPPGTTVTNASLNGLDLCSPSLSDYLPGVLSAARDTGRVTAVNPDVPELGITLILVSPVYNGPVVPQTPAARRGRLAGWIPASFNTDAAVKAAVAGRAGVSLNLTRQDPGLAAQPIVTAAPAASSGALSQRIMRFDADGPWVLSVTGPAEKSGPSAATQATWIAIVGAVLSVLLFLLLRSLAGSRRRALDIADQRTRQLRHQALHDALTQLPNRTLILDRGEHMLARCRRQGLNPAALFIDLDGFKTVNDSLGHPIGDQLLVAVATRLSAALRASDTAGRLGGDEFIILVEDVDGGGAAETVADRVLEVIREPFDLGGGQPPLLVTASIGIATGDRESAEDLVRDADIALYQAKAHGKDRHVVFRSSMQAVAQGRLELEIDLRGALARGELFLHYQPTFRLDTGSIVGAEALIRWRHPTKGVISPVMFIPIAEETGLIIAIGRWVLAEACRQAARWRGVNARFQMSVNVSARQLDSDGFIDDVEAALRESGLPAASLSLEITESVLMRDAEAAGQRLRQLRDIGVRLAIDDFGTGYSSLAYLRQFPVDALKIDRSFISGIAASPGAEALIHTLVRLGKTLGLETVAEGIEEPAQLDRLRREECDTGQGFLLARPLDPEAIDELLEPSTALPGQRADRSPAPPG